ncbi:MAG: hypothetical protein LC778_19840 [Acidobacteria bacterium]|nr:hypothetical protein [Acidobacteriota bacterium]
MSNETNTTEKQTVLQTVREPQLPGSSTDIGQILMRAVESNVPIETLERLMALRKQLKEEAARDAFYDAMSQCSFLLFRLVN